MHNHERKQDIGVMVLFYKCAECDEKFSNLLSMRRHSKDEHLKTIVEPSLQENTSVSCQDCGLVLTNMNIVKKFTRGIMIPRIMSRWKSCIKANLLGKVSAVFVMRSELHQT